MQAEALRATAISYEADDRQTGGRVGGLLGGSERAELAAVRVQHPTSPAFAEHLTAGRIAKANPLLQPRNQLVPDDVEARYTLGMVDSDQQKLTVARELLGHAVELDPGFAKTKLALGLAALRAGDV